MASFKIKSTTSNKLLSIPVEDGSLIFVTDHSTIAWDIEGVRKLYTNIERINTSQKSDMKIPGFYYCVDTNILWQFDGTDWIQITSSSSEEQGVIPITGTVDNNIIVSTLGNGIYSITGEYRVYPGDTVNITMGRDLFIVTDNQIHKIDGKKISKYTIKDDGSTTIETYLTSVDMNAYITKTEASTMIAELIEKGVTDKVIETIEYMIATEEDLGNPFLN